MPLENDETLMRLALEEARAAADAGDVPVGALVVDAAGQVLAAARNRRESDLDPTAHAEVLALRAAAQRVGRWRLSDATVSAPPGPCSRGGGALVNARIARLVYGCADPKSRAIDTLFTIGRDGRLNHRFEVTGGVLDQACADVLRAFFAPRRAKPAP